MGYDPERLYPVQPNRFLCQPGISRCLRGFDAMPALRAAHRNGTQLYGKVDAHFAPQGHRIPWDAAKADVIGLVR